ncbi:branched chain amino acid ABC transporter substrate-binding protein [Paraburkholderia hospita]|nr:branched chain amino acid ABC transporter substrate-binding protein [Paraburkholderia hospita]
MRRLPPFVYSALFLSLSAAASSFAQADDQVVRIGFAAPLTGPSAADGKEMENAVRLAIDDANARQPKLAGQAVKFALVSQDDQSDPRIAAQIAQRFADSGVAGVVGHFNSSCSIAAARIYSDAGIAEVSPSSTGAAYTLQGYHTTFRVVGQDAVAGTTLANYLLDTLHAKRIAIIDDQTDFGRGLAERVEQTLRGRYANIVARDYVNDKTIDFSAVLTKIRGVNPDVIVFGGFDAQAGQVVRRMRGLGVHATLAGEGFNNSIFIDMAKGNGEGTVTIQPGTPPEKLPGRDFQTRYQVRFGAPLQGFQGPYAYDAANVLIHAVLKAQSGEPVKVLAAVKTTSLSGTTGPIRFDTNGDLAGSPYTVYRLTGSNWQDVAVINSQR